MLFDFVRAAFAGPRTACTDLSRRLRDGVSLYLYFPLPYSSGLDGKVHLDDEISPYSTDPPVSWKGIDIRNLLSHTSGLPDVVEADVGGVEFVSYSTEQLLANIKRQDLLFPPCTGYEYTSSGPIL
jgi:Beta-lactamase